MARYSEDPVKNIISFRVNKEEKERIEALAKGLSVSISFLLRHSLNVIESYPEQLHAQLTNAGHVK